MVQRLVERRRMQVHSKQGVRYSSIVKVNDAIIIEIIKALCVPLYLPNTTPNTK